MRTDRRGFLRAFTGALGLLAGGSSPAGAQDRVQEIHRATRNTRFGPVGALRPRRLRPQRRSKAYAGAPRVALPGAEAPQTRALAAVLSDFRAAEGFAAEPIALAELARLLHFTNGVTGAWGDGEGLQLRAAPSAGALYAGEIYVVAERVAGLDAGVYYYSPLRHDLASIRPGARLAEVWNALERAGAIEGAPAAILLTNVFARYSGRYANRGYRYALIDSGHIGENLRLAARSARLAEVSPLRFHDDRLNALLEIDGREEAVCALHVVGRPAPGAPAPRPAARHLAERGRVEPETLPSGGPAPERYHEATKLVPAAASQTARDASASGAAAAHGGAPPDTSVEECILRRRSAESFAPRPLARATLDWILQAAAGHPALTRAPGVELMLAAHRVADLAPGLYRFEARGAGLVPMRSGDLRQSLVSACVDQEKAGSCGVALFMVARLRAVAATGGARGYRDLLLESGAMGQRIYLSAEAAGLAARNLAAFRDDELNDLLALDGRERAVLHLTAVGYEQPAAG
ncbi:MAG TPA: SagB/ThcOx family dehydrogenase [Myxococcota bacterium]